MNVERDDGQLGDVDAELKKFRDMAEELLREQRAKARGTGLALVAHVLHAAMDACVIRAEDSASRTPNQTDGESLLAAKEIFGQMRDWSDALRTQAMRLAGARTAADVRQLSITLNRLASSYLNADADPRPQP